MIGLARRRILAAAVIVVLAAIAVGGLLQLRVDTSMRSFLPAGDVTYEALEDKAKSFGGDPVVVLVESKNPRELLVEPEQLMRLLRLEGRLAKLPDVAGVYGPATMLNQTAASVQNVLAQISGHRDALRKAEEQKAKAGGASEDDARAAGRKAVAAFDQRYGELLVRGLPAGLPTLRNPRFVASVLFTQQGQPRDQWRTVLPNANTVAVLVRPREGLDQEAAGTLTNAVRRAVNDAALRARKVTVTGVPVVTARLSERAQQEMPVLGAVAVAAVGDVFLLVPWSRRRRARLRPLAAALLGTALTAAAFGWLGHPLSLGVVAFLPILMGIGSDFPYYLARPGGRRRVVVAATAAAAAFASLALSPLPFVRELGLALAVGIVLTVALALVFARLFGPPAATPEPPGGRTTPVWPLRRRVTVAVVAAGVAAVGWGALPQLGIEARPDQLARGLPELEQARHAEEVLGSSGELSIVLHGKNVTSPEALAWTRKAQQTLVQRHGDELHPLLTLADLLRFLGPEPTAEQISAAMKLLPRYLTTAVVRSDRSSALLSFGVELRDIEQQRDLLGDIRAALPPPPRGYRAELVGIPVSAVRGLDLVSDSRAWVNLAGIAAAGLVLAFGLRRRSDALRAVLTVLLATGWVLAAVWALTGALNPLTVAIGSLTTATGCEFAVMLAARPARRRWIWRGVGTAALAGTVGYAVLGLYDLAMLRDFGFTLAAGVALSFLAALLVTRLWPVRRPSPAPVRADAAPPARRKEVTV